MNQNKTAHQKNINVSHGTQVGKYQQQEKRCS